MVAQRVVVFETDGHEADEQFLREYVVPEYDRLTGIEGCDGVRYSRYGADPRTDHGEIHLAIFGDHEAVVAAERDRWDEFAEEGLIRDWETTGLSWEDWPDEQFECMADLQLLASEMGLAYFDRFDPGERPAPADAFPEADRRLGVWVASHFLLNQMGYEVRDELDASFQSIRNRLRALVGLRDAEYARDRVEELRRRLDDVEDEIEELSDGAAG